MLAWLVVLCVCYRKQIDLNRECHFTRNFWNATSGCYLSIFWHGCQSTILCHAMAHVSSQSFSYWIQKWRIASCQRSSMLCVRKEKNNKLFCWCRWDEVTGCKKRDTSCSHLWFCDLISITDEIYFLGVSLNLSWCLTTIPSISHEVLLQRTASL